MINGQLIEKAWMTAAGLRARVCLTDIDDVMTFRCGYVAVPLGHPLHGPDEDKRTTALPAADDCAPIPSYVLDVHGGLTFAGERVADDGVTADPDWWFGFDCAHAGDEWMFPKGGIMDGIRQKVDAEMKESWPDYDAEEMARMRGSIKTLEFCVAECESLAAQIVAKTIVRTHSSPEANP